MVTREWTKDTGVVLAVIILILGRHGGTLPFFFGIGILLVALLVPQLLYPLGYIWYRLSQFLAVFGQKIVFGFLFYVLFTPIGFIRKIISKYTNKSANQKETSSFIVRKHLFTVEDIRYPY